MGKQETGHNGEKNVTVMVGLVLEYSMLETTVL